ncbi:MAG: SpoIID/LytB domain-containing protein, partial [Elusimicrobiota bacterium]
MYKRFSVLFTVLLVITLFVPTLPAEDVRVGLTYVSSGFSNNLSNKTILYLRGSPSTTEYEIVDLYTGYVIFTGAGVQNVEARSGYIYVTGKGPYANPVIIRAKNPGTEFVSVGYNNWQFKVYRGRFEARVSNGYVKLVNIVDLDEYIYGVVPVEIGGTSPVEALKAQAVVARTLAIIRRNLNIHQADGFDVCDLTHCQVYGSQYSNKGGYSVETTKCCAAVDDTAGILLYYNGSLVKDMTYHGHCGGKVANIEDIWGGSASPYLKGLDDSSNGTVFCAWDFTYNAWEKSITQSELQSKLKGNANTAPANSASTLAADGISISEYDSSGRAKYITIKYETPAESKVVRGNTFRGVVGYTYLPSHLITALTYSSASGVYIFKGKGSGHGAGMCQDGAIGMGDHGYTYNQILQHYFTTSISIVDKGGPNILHVPVTQTVAKKQFIVSVTATDRSGVQSVDVYYRTAGRLVYTQKKGVSVAVNVYEVIVDSGVVTTAGVEYYIKVVDTAGNLAYSGSDTVPYKVNVNDSDTDPPSIVHSVNQYAFEQTTITVTASVND